MMLNSGQINDAILTFIMIFSFSTWIFLRSHNPLSRREGIIFLLGVFFGFRLGNMLIGICISFI
jgi:hypothetical protein